MRRLFVLCFCFVLLAGVAGAQSERFSAAPSGASAAGHAASTLALVRLRVPCDGVPLPC